MTESTMTESTMQRGLLSRQGIEYSIVVILVLGWLIKLVLWFTPFKLLKQLGIEPQYLTYETAISMLMGGILLYVIYLRRNHYENPKLFWGSAVSAGCLSTITLLTLLVLGILGKYFGLELPAASA